MNKYPEFTKYGYQIIKVLGDNLQGGRVTYLATNIESNKQVIIKEFRFASADANWSGFKAYQREIEVLQQLNHPQIPPYLNTIETSSGFCLVTEYINAPSLGERYSFTPEEIKQIAVSNLEILVDLQKYSPPIIHRDIKPENILVDKSLNIYLIDFGLARIRPRGEQALSSIAAGTPGFMPPEEMFNLPLTEASDLYSLGATLICLLTGTKSGEVSNLIGEDYRFKFKHLVHEKVNQGFIAWLEKLVEPNVKRRYPNASFALKKLKPILPTKTNNFIEIDKVKPLAITALLMIVAGINIKVFQYFSRQQKTAASLTKANKQDSEQSISNPLSQAVKLEKQGDNLYNSGQYDEALVVYDQAIELNPNYAAAWYGRCRVLRRFALYQESLKACDKVLEINPNAYWAWHVRGSALNSLMRTEEALESYNKSLEIKPDYHHAWNGRCWAFNNLQKYQEALNSCDKALEIAPNDVWSWNNQGLSLKGLKRYDEALESFNRAIEINPNFQKAINNRKNLLDNFKQKL